MQSGTHGKAHRNSPYGMLGIMLVVNTAIMYVLMFEMIATGSEFYNNLNMFYMAVTMAAPMAILMVAMMGGMYPNRRLNIIIYAASAIILIGSFFAIRTQAGIADSQFLRSMIPHHSGAVLMCKEATITDPEIQSLCSTIIKSQEEEIAQMKGILARQ